VFFPVFSKEKTGPYLFPIFTGDRSTGTLSLSHGKLELDYIDTIVVGIFMFIKYIALSVALVPRSIHFLSFGVK